LNEENLLNWQQMSQKFGRIVSCLTYLSCGRASERLEKRCPEAAVEKISALYIAIAANFGIEMG
jgi:hypothetical protein